jgi:hypothetical protein
MRNSNPDLDDGNSNIIMGYYFYVSNDKTHDNYFVQHYLLLHLEDIVNGGFRPKRHWIRFYGCASQFKSKIPFYFVSRHPHSTSGCCLVWNFFGSRNKKGPHDGAGVVMKRFIKDMLNLMWKGFGLRMHKWWIYFILV